MEVFHITQSSGPVPKENTFCIIIFGSFNGGHDAGHNGAGLVEKCRIFAKGNAFSFAKGSFHKYDMMQAFITKICKTSFFNVGQGCFREIYWVQDRYSS